jgi:hypothetical protein
MAGLRPDGDSARFEELAEFGLYSSDSSDSSDSSESDDEFEDALDDGEMLELQDEWRDVSSGRDTGASRIEFTGIPGVNPGVTLPDDVEDVGAFLRLFLTDDLLRRIAQWTNARAWAAYENSAAEDEEMQKILINWKDINEREVSKLIGMHLFMGVSRKPEMHDYWATEGIHVTPFFQTVHALSRDRYKQVLSFLRFYDATEEGQEGDELRKVRPFLTLVQELCSNVYQPEQQVSVDESLILYKGRLLIRQFIPTKRARFGIKIYCACEASSGYLFNFIVHSTTAQNARIGENLDCNRLPMSERIVVTLCRSLLNFGYHVFVDKWFTSTRLAEFLIERQTLLTGTVRQDRGVPQALRDQRVAANNVAFMRRGKVLAIKAVEKRSGSARTLYMVDTNAAAEKVAVERVGKHGEILRLRKSRSALNYSSCMCGVDRKDSKLKPYDPCRKTCKWFHKLCLLFCLLLVHNAWVVYHRSGGSLAFGRFLDKSIVQLVESTGHGRKRIPVPRINRAVQLRQQQQHYPTRLPPRPTNPRPVKRCRICCQARVEKRSAFCCAACPGSPGLCLEPCFQLWHDNQR